MATNFHGLAQANQGLRVHNASSNTRVSWTVRMGQGTARESFLMALSAAAFSGPRIARQKRTARLQSVDFALLEALVAPTIDDGASFNAASP